jgi:Protein of unknown function (DUF3467)
MPQHSSRTSPHVASKGLYANYFEVGHTALEFVVDFGQRYEGKGATPCHTRIVMSPLYAEELLRTLSESLAQYRERFEVAK